MADHTDKPRFNISISELSIVCYILGAYYAFMALLANHFIISIGEAQKDLELSGIEAFNPENGWPFWADIVVVILSGIPVSIIALICLWLIRCSLPQRLKPYITWRKPKDE